MQDGCGSRGITDHEHLDGTGFIHMNGRVYDPRIGRFVSPDPIVQAPWFSQSYNRYAYVFGSPVSFTDPSGFNWEGVGQRGGCDEPPSVCLEERQAHVWQSLMELVLDDWIGAHNNAVQWRIAEDFRFTLEGLIRKTAASTDIDPPTTVEAPDTDGGGGISGAKPVVSGPNGVPVIDSTYGALRHYYGGVGEEVELGPKTISALKSSPEHQLHSYRIRTGQTTGRSGNYGVNLRDEIYHVGKTTIQYSTVCSASSCTTTYTGFTRNLSSGGYGPDGFWDIFSGDDAVGPQGEWGGHPFPYTPYRWTETYPTPYR